MGSLANQMQPASQHGDAIKQRPRPYLPMPGLVAHICHNKPFRTPELPEVAQDEGAEKQLVVLGSAATLSQEGKYRDVPTEPARELCDLVDTLSQARLDYYCATQTTTGCRETTRNRACDRTRFALSGQWSHTQKVHLWRQTNPAYSNTVYRNRACSLPGTYEHMHAIEILFYQVCF